MTNIKILKYYVSLYTQQRNFSKKTAIMATQAIYNLYTEFINNDNYKKYFNCV